MSLELALRTTLLLGKKCKAAICHTERRKNEKIEKGKKEMTTTAKSAEFFQLLLFAESRGGLFKGDFFIFLLFTYDIQDCLICRLSDSTVSEDAVIEPRTVATTALAVRRSNHSARSHPHSARSHPGKVSRGLCRYSLTFKAPWNRFRQHMYSSLAGRYENPFPTRFLAPIYCSKIPALVSFLLKEVEI
jgi:hypothetical protein